MCTDIATSEVTTLQHELRDDAVELAALVAEALLAGAESTEVLSGLRDYIVVEVEVDATLLSCCKRLVSTSSQLIETRSEHSAPAGD
jgi:hypothetical protein